ncbi:MAG: hypothetical protein K8L99_13300 [Anaerolineae bacterium]|nr:hypothetical protein [Anaerolineae bacterium]
MSTSEVTHRRETRRLILLPFALGLLLIIACVVVVLLLRRGSQVSLVSDLLVTIFMLCPAVLCMLPITILVIMSAFGMNQVHDLAARPLRQIESYSKLVSNKAAETSAQVSEKTINVSARFGAVYRLLNTFNRLPSSRSENDHE